MTSEARTAVEAGTGGAQVIVGDGVAPFQLTPHNCFACGARNRNGLGLVLHVERARAWTELALSSRFEGWDGIAHGGIVCTILDEVMAWALVGDDNWGLTARMAVEFKKPVPVGAPIRADGWITRSRRRLIDTEARVVDADGTVLAAATATYLAADGERRRELQARYGFRLLGTDEAADR